MFIRHEHVCLSHCSHTVVKDYLPNYVMQQNNHLIYIILLFNAANVPAVKQKRNTRRQGCAKKLVFFIAKANRIRYRVSYLTGACQRGVLFTFSSR